MFLKPLFCYRPFWTLPRKATVTVKPKVTPVPKFTPPTLAQFKQSAAYKTDSMTYKEYVDAIYDVYKYKLKKGK